MSELADIQQVDEENYTLTDKISAPFVLLFKYRLFKNYTFKELQRQDNKKLQGFLDKFCNMTYQQVDYAFRRKNDKNDTYGSQQIVHYGDDDFRLHGVLEDGAFVVIRIDPNHRVHQ